MGIEIRIMGWATGKRVDWQGSICGFHRMITAKSREIPSIDSRKRGIVKQCKCNDFILRKVKKKWKVKKYYKTNRSQ